MQTFCNEFDQLRKTPKQHLIDGLYVVIDAHYRQYPLPEAIVVDTFPYYIPAKVKTCTPGPEEVSFESDCTTDLDPDTMCATPEDTGPEKSTPWQVMNLIIILIIYT
jgi:hypothetical protein